MTVNSVDEYVGAKLKLKRSSIGITQNELGDMVGVTFQQIQKYEKGANRIGAGKLYEFSKILNVPINYFFDGFDDSKLDKAVLEPKQQQTIFESFNLPDKEINLLLKFYSRINDKKIRNSVINLAKSLSSKK